MFTYNHQLGVKRNIQFVPHSSMNSKFILPGYCLLTHDHWPSYSLLYCIVLYIICISFMIDKDCTSHLTMMTRLLKSGSCLMGLMGSVLQLIVSWHLCLFCISWFSSPELSVTLKCFLVSLGEPEQINKASYCLQHLYINMHAFLLLSYLS